MLIGCLLAIPFVKDGKDNYRDNFLIAFVGALAVLGGVNTILFGFLYSWKFFGGYTNYEHQNIKENIDTILKTKPKFQTICEVYERRFLVYHRKVHELIETFEFEHWVTDARPNNLPIKHKGISIINLEFKLDDEDTALSYQEHLEQINRRVPQQYQNKEGVKTKFIQLITIGEKNIPLRYSEIYS